MAQSNGAKTRCFEPLARVVRAAKEAQAAAAVALSQLPETERACFREGESAPATRPSGGERASEHDGLAAKMQNARAAAWLNFRTRGPAVPRK